MPADAGKPKPKSVTIFVNNNEVEIPDKDTTGQEIKEKAGVPVDFTLYRKHGEKLEEIKNEDPVKVHEHENFIAVSGQDVS
jgi:hypothetical protein